MSQGIVPNWNLKQERQEEQVVEGGEGRNRSPHVHSDQNLSYVVPMSNYDVTELTWENGQISLHGLGGIASPNSSITPQTKQSTWNSAKPGGTLESIVHQATTFSKNYNFPQNVDQVKWGENSNSHMQMIQQNGGGAKVDSNIYSGISGSGGKWGPEKSAGATTSLSGGGLMRKKRVRSELEQNCDRKIMNSFEESDDQSGTATFCKDNTHTSTADTTMMTWPPSSFGSPCRSSFKTAPCRNTDEDSACHCSENQDGDRMTKGESSKSQSSARRSRAAAIHNLSERRRRDRINEKMRALQKLVPNASKTDKASMLDEVIEYLKQLQAQVHMMSNARSMPQMMMPLGMQQQIQMSLLARMGMGMGMGMEMGMGMLDVNNLARNVPHSLPPLIPTAGPLGSIAPSFASSPFTMPTPLKANVDLTSMSTSMPNFNDAYNTFLAQQSMNMDFLNKMAALYRQQANQQSKKPATLSQPNNGQRE